MSSSIVRPEALEQEHSYALLFAISPGAHYAASAPSLDIYRITIYALHQIDTVRATPSSTSSQSCSSRGKHLRHHPPDGFRMLVPQGISPGAFARMTYVARRSR